MMTREQYIQRLEEIERLKRESKERQHEQCTQADSARVKVQHAMIEARDNYMRVYRRDMQALQDQCIEEHKKIRLREESVRQDLSRQRWELEADWADQRRGEHYTLPQEELEKGGAV